LLKYRETIVAGDGGTVFLSQNRFQNCVGHFSGGARSLAGGQGYLQRIS
jgi:hypothetical protein